MGNNLNHYRKKMLDGLFYVNYAITGPFRLLLKLDYYPKGIYIRTRRPIYAQNYYNNFKSWANNVGVINLFKIKRIGRNVTFMPKPNITYRTAIMDNDYYPDYDDSCIDHYTPLRIHSPDDYDEERISNNYGWGDDE